MRGRIVVAFLLVAGVWVVAQPPALALELNGVGSLIGPAFVPEVGDELTVFVANVGPRPFRAEIQLLRADDFTVIDTSGTVVVAAGTTLPTDTFIPSDFPVLVRVNFRAQMPTVAKVSLQLKDPAGVTKIFTDGFESGDLAN